MNKKLRQLINPHSHSDHSIDGAATVKQIIKRNIELGASYVALTEHGNMNSAMELYTSCRNKKVTMGHSVKPILGIEAYIINPFHNEYVKIYETAYKNGMLKLKSKEPDKIKKELEAKAMNQYLHVTIHFKDEWAYRYFCELSPKMWSRAIKKWGEEKPLITMDELEKASGHITIMSSCMKGPVQNFLLPSKDGIIQPSKERAEYMYLKLKEIAGNGNFFVEIFPHSVTHNWQRPEYDRETGRIIKEGYFKQNECTCYAPDGDLQKPLNLYVLELAKKYKDKPVISLDSHFATPNQKQIQDAKLGNGEEAWRFYESYYIYSTDEAAQRIKKTLNLSDKDIEEFVDNSYEWASNFDNFSIKMNEDRWILEDKSLEFTSKLKKTIEKYGRMDFNNKEMVERLQKEIKVLAYNGKINLLSYFYIVEDIANFCKENDILINVRGSAGGSLLLYLIGVSSVNPIKHDLSFERFLTEGRIKANTLPDVDIDVSDQEKVFNYLRTKYKDRFARISIDINLKLKSSIKDAERAILGAVRKTTEDLCKQLPNTPQGVDDHDFVFGYVDSNGNYHKGLFDENNKLQEYAKNNPEIWQTVAEMLGIQRNKSKHACGVIIADKPVHECCPTIMIGGEIVTGFSPKSIEAAGLIKFDILGLNTLRDIQNALKSIKERLNQDVDIWNLPYDEECFKNFADGKTETVFQFDTTVVRPYLSKIKPNSIDDLAVITALCRPGTLDAPYGDGRTLSEVFVARKQGEPIKYIHPDLEPILKETMGIQLFQEQTLRIFRDIGGFSYEEAETVRRGIGKKEEKVLAEATQRLKESCLSRGWTSDQVNLLIEQIMASANYSFNKSHAVSYAYVAYACMYLKTKYRLDWWKATLSNSDKKEMATKFWQYIQDFTLLPDINLSSDNYTILGDKIVSPISILNGIGPKAYEKLIAHAPYQSLENFLEIHLNSNGTAVNSSVIKKLIVAGILDSLFEKGGTIEEKLHEFEKIKAKIKNKYIEPIDEKYIGMTELGRYMVKKQLISIYSQDLRPIVLPPRGGYIKDNKKFILPMGNTELCILDGNQIEWIREQKSKGNLIINNDRYWGAIAYVIDEKAFTYKNKTKQATRLFIDINGYFCEEILWPKYDENIAEFGFKGNIILVIYKENSNSLSLHKILALLKNKDFDQYNMV